MYSRHARKEKRSNDSYVTGNNRESYLEPEFIFAFTRHSKNTNYHIPPFIAPRDCNRVFNSAATIRETYFSADEMERARYRVPRARCPRY